ncbi:hypothetical protein FOZ62_007266, partial [Perkinsus olseni]
YCFIRGKRFAVPNVNPRLKPNRTNSRWRGPRWRATSRRSWLAGTFTPNFYPRVCIITSARRPTSPVSISLPRIGNQDHWLLLQGIENWPKHYRPPEENSTDICRPLL